MTRSTRGSKLDICKLSEDGENIVAAINGKIDLFRKDFDDFKKEFHETIAAKNTEILALKNEVHVLNSRLSKMEDKLIENDTKNRENSIVLSGEEVPPSTSGENCIVITRELFQQKLNLVIPTSDIVSASRLWKKQNAKQNILIKLRSFETKMNIIKACKTVKPKFFVNDDLSAEKQTIMYVIRQAKRKFPQKIDGCSSIGGKIFAYVKDVNDEGTNGIRNRRIPVNNLEKLKDFCTKVVGRGLETFIESWPY